MPIDDKFMQWADKEFSRKNYPACGEHLRAGLAKCLDDLEARKKLRRVARQNLIENPAKGLSKMKKAGQITKLKTVLMTKKKPEDIAVAAEDVLFEEPNDIATLQTLAGAFEELEQYDTVQWILDDALHLDDKNVLLWTSMGELYETKLDRLEDAKECYTRVLKLDSKQNHILKKLRAIEAQQAMAGSKKEGGGEQLNIKDSDATLDLEILRQVIRNADDARKHVAIITKDLEKDPENVKIMEKIADRYRQGELFNECIEWLEKALEKEPNNETIRIRIGEVKLQKVRAQKDKLEAMYKKDPKNAKVVENYKKARIIELKMGMSVYKEWVAAHPTDTGMKFKYGEYLFQAKNYKEALSMFQKCVSDPKISDQSSEYLAKCFMGLGKHKMAIKPLDTCLSKTNEGGDWWKELTYQKAKCLMEIGEEDAAKELYEKIYEIDIDFRDVSDLI